MEQEAKARDLIVQAEKKLKGSWIFGGPKYEDACELFEQAANNFKMAKKWQEAADAFSQAADCQIKLQSKHEAASHFVSASNCLRKTDAIAAIETLKKAVDIFSDLGRFNIAAKHQKEIAEIYESELVDLPKAIEAYELAAEWYQGEESKSAANNCLLKVALFSAQIEKYEKAIKIYEQIATSAIDTPVLRFSVKDYFLRAGLCHLCTGDTVTTQRALERYLSMDSSLNTTREYTFLKNILAAYESGDVEAFTNHVVEYDSFSKLDNWKTTILLRIKRTIRDEPSLI